MNSEDEVVGAFTHQLRSRGFTVLAEGGNQAAAFRYSIGSIVKAPDVVAICDLELVVAEGKILSRELFRGGIRGVSDFDACIFLAGNDDAQAKITEEAVRRCLVSEIECPPLLSLKIRPIMFAHEVRAADVAKAEEARITLITV